MAGLQVSGLVSNIDTTSIISQLMQVEANPQTLLKNKLVSVQADAAAYRAVNTRFAALRTAAAALSDATLTTGRKATSSDSSVTTTATTSAVTGTMTRFAVVNLAATQTSLSTAVYGSTTADISGDASFPLEIHDANDAVVGTITPAAGESLDNVVSKINAGSYGVKAAVVSVGTNQYRLQLTSTQSGTAGAFSVVDGNGASLVVDTTDAADATLDLGGGQTATSSTNTFANLLTGVSVTVGKADPSTWVNISVGNDVAGVGNKVQAVVDAANSLLETISSYTDPASDTAILKGDATLRDMAGQILDMVSSGVSSADGSKLLPASMIGIQTTKDGKLTFDQSALTSLLASDPTSAARLLTSTKLISPGPDGTAGNADDVTTPVGLMAQLAQLGKTASDTTTGTLVMLAKSEDSEAKDLQDRIDDWDTRLAMRKETLTAQFTAMTTALSSLQNQSSWLTSQVASLPSWSASSK